MGFVVAPSFSPARRRPGLGNPAAADRVHRTSHIIRCTLYIHPPGGCPTTRSRETVIGLLCVLASALAWFLSTGAHDVWILAWLAPAPVLVVAYSTSVRRAAIAAFAAALLGSLAWLELYHGLLPPLVIARAVFIPAVVFTLVVLAARYIWRRQPTYVGLFAFPVLAAAADYLVATLSPDGSFGSVAYTQAGVLPILQIASVVGLWGVTFLVSLVASGLATAWLRRGEPRDFLVAAGVPAVIVALAAGLGAVRLSLPLDAPGVRVGLAATDATVRDADHPGRAAVALSVIRAYAGRIRQLAADGAKVVVLPEKFVGVTSADRAEAQDLLARAAASAHVWVVAGVNEIGISPKRNVALVITPDGQVAISYLQQHLFEGVESGYQRGYSAAVWGFEGRRAGVAIGSDLDVPSVGREYAAKGVGLLFVPASDFVRDGRLRARMAVVRGVEGGFGVVRTARQGRLTVSDPYGRIVAARRSDAAPDVLLAASVPAAHVVTVYDRIGDWFAWACMIVAIGMTLAAATPHEPAPQA